MIRILGLYWLLGCQAPSPDPVPIETSAQRDLDLLMQAEREGVNTCGEIADASVKAACLRLLERAHLRGVAPAGPLVDGSVGVIEGCDTSSGAERDICILNGVKKLGSATEPEKCLAIANSALRRECVTFWAAAGWSPGVDGVLATCELLGTAGRDECVFEVAENRALPRFDEALELCWNAGSNRPMCVRHAIRIQVSHLLDLHHEGEFAGFVGHVEELQPLLETREWSIGGAGPVHTLWSDAFQLLAAHAVHMGRPQRWRGLQRLFPPDDERGVLWRDVLYVAVLRDAISGAAVPPGGWTRSAMERAMPPVSEDRMSVTDMPLVAPGLLLRGPSLPAPWDVKPKNRRLSLMPYWAEPFVLRMGSNCAVSTEMREAVRAVWASVDLPVTQLEPLLAEVLASSSPAVRGTGLAALARTLPEVSERVVVSRLLSAHRSGESVAALRDLSSEIEAAESLLAQQRLEGVLGSLCP